MPSIHRHQQIHHRHSGPQCARQAQPLRAIGTLTDHLDRRVEPQEHP